MSWKDIIKIVAYSFTSIGGAGAIIYIFSSYFGKMWADKYLEKIKMDYQKEIEHYKNQLEILRESSLRYSSRQFELYNTLWQSLYELKIKADALWEEANQNNLYKFAEQLKHTIDQIEKSALFIENSHYEDLKSVLNQFRDYKIGKSNLIEFRNKFRNIGTDTNIHMYINELIKTNGQYKKEYEELLEIIKAKLKSQIKGEN